MRFRNAAVGRSGKAVADFGFRSWLWHLSKMIKMKEIQYENLKKKKVKLKLDMLIK